MNNINSKCLIDRRSIRFNTIGRIVIALCCLLISSCIGSEFQRERILGDYFLITTDNYNKDIYIGYKLESGDFVGVLPSKVSEIGKNEEFIIAKQSKDLVNKSEFSYYIIKKWNIQLHLKMEY